MESSDRKAEILDVSMKIACKYGLSAFTTKKVAEYAGISEALIYKYFYSKDKLLYSCFEVVHRKVAALMAQRIRGIRPAEVQLEEFIHQMWFPYFNLLVREDYRTIFYFSYRDSKYINTVLEHNDEVVDSYFKEFARVIYMLDEKFDIYKKVEGNLLWTYILDATGIFARRTILGEIPKSDKNTEMIWSLIFRGISGILDL